MDVSPPGHETALHYHRRLIASLPWVVLDLLNRRKRV